MKALTIVSVVLAVVLAANTAWQFSAGDHFFGVVNAFGVLIWSGAAWLSASVDHD